MINIYHHPCFNGRIRKKTRETWKIWKYFISHTFYSGSRSMNLKRQYFLEFWMEKFHRTNKQHPFQYELSLKRSIFHINTKGITHWYITNINRKIFTLIPCSSEKCMATHENFIPVTQSKKSIPL